MGECKLQVTSPKLWLTVLPFRRYIITPYSIPNEVIGFFSLPSSRIMDLGST
jgi:hypothetical protein